MFEGLIRKTAGCSLLGTRLLFCLIIKVIKKLVISLLLIKKLHLMTLYSCCGCRDNHAVKVVMVKMVKKHNLKHRVLITGHPICLLFHNLLSIDYVYTLR